MLTLKFAPDGLFPIVFDKNGAPIPKKPRTGYDFPGTIQGEGKLAGVPSLFLRLSGCNLSCRWMLPSGEVSLCDSPEASANRINEEEFSIGEVIDILKYNTRKIRHVVITGGEPTLQRESLIPFVKMVKKHLGLHLTLESNGTLFDESLFEMIDLISISPKLSSSFGGVFFNQEHFDCTRDTIKQVVNLCKNGHDFQLKFVVSSPKDLFEIKDLIAGVKDLKNEDVLLMPLGGSESELSQTRSTTSLLAVENGWRFSPRLHIDIWGNRMGV